MVTIFTGKISILLLITGLFTLTRIAPDRANFSGEWKLNETESEMEQFPLCIFGGDRIRSNTLKIAAQRDLLTIDFVRSGIARQEQLVFDGEESKATYVGTPRERSSAKWSEDSQTMTVTSVRSFDRKGETPDFKVTEVWKLINEGKSISIHVYSRSASGQQSMLLVYDKIN